MSGQEKAAAIFSILAAAWLVWFSIGQARGADERYGAGTPARDARGRIARSRVVLALFKLEHPCPSTGRASGICPGWIMDHVIPLACGGRDAIENLQWLPKPMWAAKSKWERKVYSRSGHECGRQNDNGPRP